ncbi:MAG: bifunctional pyr operon transcriptional regulator/uracil phosphoribosyltransferase PyrR [Candidatus Melainabacteria bacterium]|nr:bifunctional pyr operon transcriptional regulator/uracil phosphoribosyltransferase PyrR [Candidatus Melainabacteria bacterium]MBI3309303.1 bifunctional pyr operon transcriptional regulator/uracil phosphoribosyltransferase PyrR [Candidatus Melainabacteria bacterium]
MTVILDSNEITKTLRRLTHEVIENYVDLSKLVLIGIVTRGEYIALRVRDLIRQIEKTDLLYGYLDVTLYRDDLDKRKALKPSKSSNVPNVDGKNVLLIDDVLFEGRTVRAALDALRDFGRPESVKLLVLVDRGGRKLPISADFTGKCIQTNPTQIVKVNITETDGKDSIELLNKVPVS